MSPEGLQNPSLTLAVAGGRGGSLEVADVSHEPVGCVPWRPLSRFLSLPSARSDAPAATFPDGRSSLRARFGLLATALDEPLPFSELWPYLQQHGSHCLAWSYFQAGLRHFLLPGVGFVAYTPMQQPAYTQVIVLGAPVCSKESVGQLLRVFLSRYPRAMFMQIPHELGAHLSAEHGYLVNALGGETQLDVSSYSYKGNNKKALRLVAAKAKRSGLVVEEVHRPGLGPLGSGQGQPGCMASVPQRAPGAALSPGLAAQLRRVSEEWMEGKGLSAKGAWFLVRRPTFELEAPGTRTFVAWQHASATAHPPLPAASKHLPPLATTTPSLLQRLRSHLSGGPPSPSPHQAPACPLPRDSSTCSTSHSTSTPACPPHAGAPLETPALARTVSAMGSGAALLPAHQRHDSAAAAAAAALRRRPAAALSLPSGLQLTVGPGWRGAAAAPEEVGAGGGGGVGQGCGDVWGPGGGRHVVGFVVLDPMWDQGRVTGYYANIVRAGRGSHSGTSALLIQEIMAMMKEEQQQQQQQQQQASGSVPVPGGGGVKEGRVSQRQRLKAAKAARAAQDADLTLQAQGQGQGQGQSQVKGQGQGTVQVPLQGRGKGKGKGKGQGVALGQGQGLAALEVAAGRGPCSSPSCGPASLATSPTALKAVTAVQSLAAAVSVHSVPLPLPCEPPTPQIRAVPLTALDSSQPATPVDDRDSLGSQQLWKVGQEGQQQQQQQQLAGGNVACKAGNPLLEGCKCDCECTSVPEVAALSSSSSSSSAGSSGSAEVVALCMPIQQQHPQQQQQPQQRRRHIEGGCPDPYSPNDRMNLEHQNGRGNLAGKPGAAGEKVPSSHSISAPGKKGVAAARGGAAAAAAAAAGVRGGARAGGCGGQSAQSPAAPKTLLLPPPQGTTPGEVPAPAPGSQPVAAAHAGAPDHSPAVAAAAARPGLVGGGEGQRLTEGQLVLTLGMSPLYCLVEERRSHVFKYSKLVRAILKSTYKLGTPFYPYKTLAAAKARYGGGASGLEARGQYDDPATRWLPMYIAMPPGATLTGQDLLQMGVTTGMLKGLFHCSKVLMREALGKALRKTGSLKKKAAAEGRGEEDGGRDQDRDV